MDMCSIRNFNVTSHFHDESPDRDAKHSVGKIMAYYIYIKGSGKTPVPHITRIVESLHAGAKSSVLNNTVGPRRTAGIKPAPMGSWIFDCLSA